MTAHAVTSYTHFLANWEILLNQSWQFFSDVRVHLEIFIFLVSGVYVERSSFTEFPGFG